MAVMVETSLGEMVIDLYTEKCPIATKNFLKLCKIKYYNNCLFHNVQKDFIAQTGDPTGTGKGGDSIYKTLYGDSHRFFKDEINPKDRHDKIGLVAMANAGKDLNASQFYITTRAGVDSLDGKHTIFGEIAEGLETLGRINESFVDGEGRPLKNIRIKHTFVLDDPFDDPPELLKFIPETSPEPPQNNSESQFGFRLEDSWVPPEDGKDMEQIEKEIREKDAHSRAVVLEMVGDLPEAEIKPPENVLFVCKLNPVTEDEDLEIIFSRFGTVVSADVIRDFKTGDSLNYAFVEFENKEACEAAYFKMDNVLIDDRRIHVDFSQSVGKLWNRFRRFGAKDSKQEPEGGRGGRSGGTGCHKCGEQGHFARDCQNSRKGEEGAGEEREKPKYEIKDTGGQIGGLRKRYDFVFEEEESGRGAEVDGGRSSREKESRVRTQWDEGSEKKRPREEEHGKRSEGRHGREERRERTRGEEEGSRRRDDRDRGRSDRESRRPRDDPHRDRDRDRCRGRESEDKQQRDRYEDRDRGRSRR